MKIDSLKARNYKSFDETQEIAFTSGFNVIAGPNSSGKTALLELMSLAFGTNPHRSLATLPTRDSLPEPSSSVDISITLERDEIFAMLAGQPTDFRLPLPMYPSQVSNEIQYVDNNQPSITRLVNYVLSKPQLTFRLRRVSEGRWVVLTSPSYGIYETQTQGSNTVFGSFRVSRDRKIETGGGAFAGGAEGDFSVPLIDSAAQRIFRFSAERLNVGECPFGTRTDLLQNAGNLPEVLNSLQQNPHLFSEFNRLVNNVLPQVRQVTVRPKPDKANVVQIIVWPHDPSSAREDLAVPLDQCGSGIGQVLAILYVAVRAPFPRVILIDEPQSFLHPGAVRKLIEVLGNYRRHQFVISTHSPGVISAADPENIIVTKLESGVSTITQVNARDNRSLQTFLAEVGVHFSDVFGADNVLWVEGTTEEVCFPEILRKVAKKPFAGTVIAGVRRTGDLETKDAARIFEIYESLSTSGTLVPPAIGFILDRECRCVDDLADIRKRSKGMAHFLSRRMYENYLLNPHAISYAMSTAEGFDAEQITPEKVAASINIKRAESKYYCVGITPNQENWIDEIHGARVLNDLFMEQSGTRTPYDKVKHGLLLTRWLIENSPEDLKDIAALLENVIAGPRRTG